LNKHWVKREKDEGRKEVYTVYTVGNSSVVTWSRAHRSVKLSLVAWKQNFFRHFNSFGGTSRLTQALLRQIEAQRDGEDVDSGLLKKVIDSYG
jgi:cullin 1